MNKALRWILLVLFVGALAAGGYWYWDSRVSAAAATTTGTTLTQVVTAERGSLSATLNVVGSLAAEQSEDLTFTEMSGTAALATLAVETGQAVSAGQALAAIDAAPYQQALDQARNALEMAEQALVDLTTPPTALELAQADVAVAAAQVDVEVAQDRLDDLQNPDITDLETAVTEARMALAQARVDLLALEQDTSGDDQLAELRQADADLYAIYVDFANKMHTETDRDYYIGLMLAYNQLMDAQDAYKTAEIEGRLSLLQAQIAVRNNEQALTEAQAALAKARAGGDALELAQAELAIRQAEVALSAAQEARAQLDEGADPTDLAAAQAEIDKQRLAVADAQEALTGTQLVAPFDGTVLDIYATAGDAIGPATTILTLANLNTFQVLAAIDETTIRQVSTGQQATITFDAYPNQTFTGQVLSVPMQGSLQGDVTVYEVPLSLTGTQALNLLVGMTANVEIQVGQATDALLVPTLALQKANGGYQVLVPNTLDPLTGQAETVPVQIGLSDGTYTQIVKGLNEGDQVIVEYESESETDMFEMGMPEGGMMMPMPGGGQPPAMPGGGEGRP